jgi:hypothetical protein
MLNNYDDDDLAAIVFNHFGDIVYCNNPAVALLEGSHIKLISSKQIRLITISLINRLITAPDHFPHIQSAFSLPPSSATHY